MQKFRDDVDRNLNVQWSVEPFRSYRNYFNVYRLEIESQDSGISCDPDDGNIRRNTPLRLNYANVCPADPLARGITYGPALQSGGGCPTAPTAGLGDPRCSGTQQHNKYLAIYLAPLGVTGQNVQTLALANTFTYGGIGGTQATTSGGSPQGPLISPHELGHSLGQLADEYPYSSRDVIKPCYTGGEPGSFHHTIRTSVQDMIDTQFKWWRWMGEESLSGGTIGLHEGGNTFPCGVRRPSEHSMMRWIGFHFDQIGREHMTERITGRRNANAMSLQHTPLGQVGPADVLWVETQHPKYHELTVTWSVNGVAVPSTGNSRNFDLEGRGLVAGDVVQVTVKDQTPFVRDPAFLDGPRMTQTRQWTVGTPLTPTPVTAAFTLSTQTDRAVGGEDVVYVETTHPTDRVLDVTWRLNGVEVANGNRRNLDLGALAPAPGTHTLSATVSDPAGGGTETRTWTVDNTLPTAPRTLSQPLTTLGGPPLPEHNVYFGEFDMRLDPQDDQPGFVVGELRENGDGWFNYFGFPDQPFGTPFTFSHSGKVVKALTYGNLGTGGLSKAPSSRRSRSSSRATARTRSSTGRSTPPATSARPACSRRPCFRARRPACTTTITGKRKSGLTVESGVTCIAGATIDGPVTVEPGASLVVSDGSQLHRGLHAVDAAVVHVFGASVNRNTNISGTTGDLIIAGSEFNKLVITGNKGSSYGVAILGNRIADKLICNDNDPGVTDFGAPNDVGRKAAGDCAEL